MTDWPSREDFYSIRPYGFCSQIARDFIRTNDNRLIAVAFTWKLSREGYQFWQDVYFTPKGEAIPNYEQARAAMTFYHQDYRDWAMDKLKDRVIKVYGEG